jgi:hypothetical protein
MDVHRAAKVRLPHFLDKRLTDGNEFVRLTYWPLFYLQEDFLVLISVTGCWLLGHAVD